MLLKSDILGNSVNKVIDNQYIIEWHFINDDEAKLQKK